MNGLIDWFTRNGVAANLLMVALFVGGIFSFSDMNKEVFPEFEPDALQITVSYPGASPEDVEQGVLLALEDAVSGLEDVDEITSIASEGSARVVIQMNDGADMDEAVSDARSAVSSITNFPADAETPEVSKATRRRDVLTVLVSGVQDLRDLHALALDLEGRIAASADVSVVEVSGAPARVLDVSISREALEAYDLTLSDVAQQITAASVQRGAGTLRTDRGDLTVRVDDRRLSEEDFASIVVRGAANGATVRLSDVATISSGYEESDTTAWLNGERSVSVGVYRVGSETPAAVSAATRAIVDTLRDELPDSISLTVLNDRSEILADRMRLLSKNAGMGLVLVLLVLTLFLDLRTAVWVAVGLMVSFVGSFIVLNWLGVTINVISLFAFLVVLGLVVDDAIVVGEQVFFERERGGDPEDGAVRGTRRMVGPIVVAVLTTCVAFAPISSIPGRFGTVFAVLPVVVIAVLALSTIESFFILPAHLAHGGTSPLWRITDGPRRLFSGALQRFIQGPYRATARFLVGHRLVALALAAAMVLVTYGIIGGGLVPVQFFPTIVGETVTATATLPPGTRDSEVHAMRERLETSGREAAGENPIDGIASSTGNANSGSEQVTVNLHLASGTEFDPGQLRQAWGRALGPVDPSVAVTFRATRGPSAGEAVNVSLSHTDGEVLDRASVEVVATLQGYEGLTNVESSLSRGTKSLELALSPEGEALGLTTAALATQVRAAYEGAQAYREIDGRTERTVRVLLPQADRVQRNQVLDLPVRLAEGAWAPLSTVARIEPSVAPAVIERSDGRREVAVTSDLAPGFDTADTILAELQATTLPALESSYPGLDARLRGQFEERQESTSAMTSLFALALFAIYGMLAASFRSYTQPLVVMSVIPFSVVGAVLGHLIVGVPLSMLSMFGVIALAGVVVNDSLVLIDAANEYRAEGLAPREAILKACERRFRPILLTTLTTSLGLGPMILETSVGAQYLIPMAVSLGFGIVTATLVVVLLVPVLYVAVEELASLNWLRTLRLAPSELRT